MVTLETGAGLSTLEFTAAGTRHTAITPSSAEINAIREEMARRKLSADTLNLIEGYSQDILPGLQEPLEMVLIDGGHGFPIPQLDWAYTAPRLKVGGALIIDDIDLWTGRILVDFLRHQPGWKSLARVRGRAEIFAATQPCELQEWCDQPWVRKRSRWSQHRRKIGNAARLVARGDFRRLREKYRHEQGLRQGRD